MNSIVVQTVFRRASGVDVHIFFVVKNLDFFLCQSNGTVRFIPFSFLLEIL